MKKVFECPFKNSGNRRCPAKDERADWRCPLALDGECAIFVIGYMSDKEKTP